MRVLFSCTAGYGHFHPLVPFAQALKRAGHEVAVAAPSFSAAMGGGGASATSRLVSTGH